MSELKHIPVMLEECMDGLKVKSGGVYFDGTLGGGGHSYEILKRSSPDGQLVATDLDEYALGRARERLSEFEGRFTLVKDNFKNFSEIKKNLNIDLFDGILLDLGVSSFQLDDKDRGFSYLAEDKELDMRMSKDNPLSAEIIVNEYSENDLKRILSDYGEERFASAIARNIVSERKKERIRTVGQLNAIIAESIPKKFQQDGHPSKRTFQAIRIEANGELDRLYETVLEMGRSLKKGGRIAIITFHSLEDRIVKSSFRKNENPCTCPSHFPVCVCGKVSKGKVITRKPILPSEEELAVNSRSKSVWTGLK